MRTLFAAVALSLVLAAPAAAQAPRLSLNSAGGPLLSGAASWRVCPPEAECRSITGGRGVTFKPAPAGTRVEALVDGAVVRSAVWGGPVTAGLPPGILDAPVTGGVVRAGAGTWTGGWGDEYDRLSVLACRTPEGSCRTMAGSGLPPGSFRVHWDVAGWYLRVVDWRVARELTDPARPWFLSGPRSSSPPVVIGAGPPQVELRRRAMRNRAGNTLGVVRCWPQCTVTLTVTQGRRDTTTTLAGRGRTALLVPRSVRLRPGLVRVSVAVDGVVRGSGFVRLVR